MRGHLLPIGLVVLLLLAPAAAATILEADTPEPRSTTGDIRILAPAVAYRDHVVHFAVAVLDATSATGYAAHADLSVSVALNDEVIFRTDAVHEHDGIHPFTVTPHETGVLQVRAAAGTSTESADGDMEAPSGTNLTLRVQDAPPHKYAGTEPYRFPFQWLQHDEDVLNLDSQHHGWTYSAQFDIFDPHGRTYLSLMPDMLNHNLIVPFPMSKVSGTARVVTGGAPSDNLTVFGEQIEKTFNGTPPATTGWYAPWVTYRDCLKGGDIIVDPPSATEGVLSFPLHTDIRLLVPPPGDTLDDPQGPGMYDVSYDIGPAGLASEWGFHVYHALIPGDPLHQITFRMPEPGSYQVMFHPQHDINDQCTLPFVVLPDLDGAPPGRLDLDIDVNGTAAAVHLAALDPQDQHLPHYEFDTRVVKLPADDASGRLVWKGKLHGHGGAASFTMGGLLAGDYEVQVFPSPETSGTPPLSADDERGFVHAFRIAGPPEEPAGEIELEASPVLTPALTLVALLVLVVLRRR